MIKVKVISLTNNEDQWKLIYVNTDFINYIEPLSEGDYAGHFLLAFEHRDFILHNSDIETIFK
jgi:hypothetical protein